MNVLSKQFAATISHLNYMTYDYTFTQTQWQGDCIASRLISIANVCSSPTGYSSSHRVRKSSFHAVRWRLILMLPLKVSARMRLDVMRLISARFSAHATGIRVEDHVGHPAAAVLDVSVLLDDLNPAAGSSRLLM